MISDKTIPFGFLQLKEADFSLDLWIVTNDANNHQSKIYEYFCSKQHSLSVFIANGFFMNADEQEFSGLVKRHKGTIYSVCLMFADNQDEANDLMQEVLVRLWKGFGTFQGKGDEKGWVWRVAMNTCITQDSKKKSFTKVPVEDNLLTSGTEDSRQMRMLHDRIHRLQLFDRAIVLLWLEDLSYDEVGQIVGISAKNVSVRLVRIKEQLKKFNG